MYTILLTGGTGFLGSRLVELFSKQGLSIISPLREEYTDDHLKKYFEKKIDAIIHTATCYGRNNETWEEISSVNLKLPKRLLEQGDKSSVKCFINADTFFNEKMGFEKNESFYVKSKKDFLEYVKEEIPSKNIKFANLRIEQMYGPNDSLKKFVPFIINELLSDKKSIPLTQGAQKRDFIYVDDVAQAFYDTFKSIDSLNKFEEFGIGTGNSISIKEAVEYLKEKTKSKSELEFGKLPYRDNEIMDSYANISNNKKIKWIPKISWKKGFDITVESYIK